MPVIAIRCTPQEKDVSFNNCLACAKSLENKCPYTAEVVKSIIENLDQDDQLNLRTTNLLDCPRCVYLEATREYTISLDDFYFAFRGQLMHSLLESKKVDRSAILERRFFKPLGEFTIHGTPDKILPKKKHLIDYKTCAEVPRYNSAYPSHVNQVNIYRWLLHPEIPIETAEIVYITMSEMKRIRIPKEKMYDFGQIERGLIEKATILSNAFKGGVPPPCPPEFPKYWKCRGYCNVADICFNEFRNGR